MVVENNYISILTKNLPKHWESFRIGSVFVERTEKVSDKDFAPLSVTMKGVVPQLDSIAKTNNGDNRKKVCINDFVINSRSDRKGSGGMSKYEGSVSLINTVLKPNDKYENRYTNYLFTNVLFQEEFYKFGKGIVDDMWSTKYFDMKYIKVPCPPIEEQIAIANHLDSQSKKIKHFIKKKQTFIELLKEQRQAVINKAFKPNKNDGWKDNRLKFFTKRIGDGLHGTPEYVNSSHYKFINGNNLRSGNIYIDEETNSVSSEEYEKYDLKLVEGSILYSINGTIGNSAFYKGEKIVLGKSAAYIEPKDLGNEVDFDYLYHYLNTDMVMIYFLEATASTTIKNLSLETLRNMPISYPIDKQKQAQIVSHIKTETAKIDQAITKAQKEIELIKEYKEAMIAEAVLGKFNHKIVKS